MLRDDVQPVPGEIPVAAVPSPDNIVDGIRNSMAEALAESTSHDTEMAASSFSSSSSPQPLTSPSASSDRTAHASLSASMSASASGAQMAAGDNDIAHMTTYERAASVIANSKITLDCKLAVFTVMGTCKPSIVKLFPSTSCSCPAKGGCYHVKAAQLVVGISEKPNRWQLNLSQLRKNKRKRQDRMCGRKRPRAEDVEIVAAGDPDDADIAELVAAIQGPSAAPDVEPDDVSPPNGALWFIL